MSINQELSFDFKYQSAFDPDQQHSNYSEVAEQWQEKIQSLQQNIQEMQQHKEDVKNTILQAQSRLKNKKSYIDEPQESHFEIKTIDTITPNKFEHTSPLTSSINHLINESTNQQEFQKPISTVNNINNSTINKQNEDIQTPIIQQQPIASFLMDIKLNHLYLQNFIDLGIYDNVGLLKSFPQINKCKYLLNKYGIDKLGHQRRILAKLDEELGLFQKKGLLINLQYCIDQIPTLKEWLKSINKQQYISNFEIAGYDNFIYLIYLEQSQYKLSVQDLLESFFIDNEQDRHLILAHIVIICDKILNCDLWSVQGIKKQTQKDNGLVQCSLPQNSCSIF